MRKSLAHVRTKSRGILETSRKMLFIHLRSKTSDRNLFDGEIQKCLVGFHDVPRTVFEKRNGRGEKTRNQFRNRFTGLLSGGLANVDLLLIAIKAAPQVISFLLHNSPENLIIDWVTCSAMIPTSERRRCYCRACDCRAMQIADNFIDPKSWKRPLLLLTHFHSPFFSRPWCNEQFKDFPRD